MPLVHYPTPSIRRDRVSSVRVFGKSLHLLAAGWAASVAWLWVATVQEQLLRTGAMPGDFGLSLIELGLVSGLVLESVALCVVKLTGAAPLRILQREEWRHAFWWSLIPNVLLLTSAYLMAPTAF
jgi:hypothetical protein